MSQPEVSVQPLEVSDSTYIVDTQMFGEANFGGVYFIDDERRTLIETGTSLVYSNVLKGLEQLDVDFATIENVILTHIHLDHAGGAGFLLDHFPRARLYVHSQGLPHLASPARLLESASRALGEAFETYGTLKPIPEGRMVSVEGGEVLDLGGRELESVYTPGHARHHVSILDRSSRTIFTGDSAGIYLPEDRRLLPTTPYPEFDYPLSIKAMEIMSRLNPRALMYTHFGVRKDALRALRDQEAEYARWYQETPRILESGDLQAAVTLVYDDWYSEVEGFPRPFVERLIANNLRGFEKYFERTGDAPGTS